MSHPFDGVEAKLRRAREHTEALTATMRETRQPGKEVPIRFSGKYEPDREAWVISVSELTEFPIEWGILICDAIYNYRSCLDLLMWGLARIDCKGAEPFARTQFPIYSTMDKFDADRGGTMTSISDPHRAMLRKVQPDFNWQRKVPHPLIVLNDLSNDGKHRVIQPAFVVPQGLTFVFAPSGPTYVQTGAPRGKGVTGRPLNKGTEVVEIPIRPTGNDPPKMEVEPQGAIQVGLRNGLAVDGVLRQIDLRVGGICEIFRPEFDSPEALALPPDVGRFHETDPGGMEFWTAEIGPGLSPSAP